GRRLLPGVAGGQAPQALQRALVVGLPEVDGAGDLGVHGRAAQLLGVDVLAYRCLHKRGPGQVQAGAVRHHELVAHDRQVRPAGDAVPHDRGQLRYAHGADTRVQVEDPAEVVLVGEDLVLHGQVDAGGVHQVDERDPVLEGDGLRP